MLKSKIEKPYEKHDCQRACQGDIFKDFEFILVGQNQEVIEFKFNYIIVLTQDCDLQQGSEIIKLRKKYLHYKFFKKKSAVV